VLTGFKFIGEQIGFLEAKGEENRYIFGFEESYGYLAGSYVRDKDAVVASMLICEMAAYYRTKGISMIEARKRMYEKYGVYVHSQHSFTFEGESGMIEMQKIMAKLREEHPTEINGLKVLQFDDYQTSISKNLTTGEKQRSPCRSPTYWHSLWKKVQRLLFVRPVQSRRSRLTTPSQRTLPKLVQSRKRLWTLHSVQ